MKRALRAAAFIATLFVGPASASAADGVSLSWVRGAGADSCASPGAVATAVEKLLGHNAFAPPERAASSIEALVSRANDRWRAEIRLVGQDDRNRGQRTIEVSESTCDALTVPAALAIALLVDPDATGARQRPADPTPSDRSCPPAVVAPVTRDVDRRDREAPLEAPPARAVIEGAAVVALGLLPGVAPGAAVGVHFETSSRWDIGVRGSLWFTRSVALRPDITADFRLTEVGPKVCRALLVKRWARVSPCVGFQFGVLHARGNGFAAPEAHDDITAEGDAVLRASVMHVRRGLHAALELGIAVPFVRHPYEFHDEQGRISEAFRAAPVAGAAAFALGASFP
jgi:hypothetical protein